MQRSPEGEKRYLRDRVISAARDARRNGISVGRLENAVKVDGDAMGWWEEVV